MVQKHLNMAPQQLAKRIGDRMRSFHNNWDYTNFQDIKSSGVENYWFEIISVSKAHIPFLKNIKL